MSEDPRRHVFPYLPPEADERIAEWRNKDRKVFVRGNQKARRPRCENCQDLGYVYLSFVYAGPFKYASRTGQGKVLVWFEGGPAAGRGWYVVKTEAFVCPHCLNGKGPIAEMPVEEEVELDWWNV